MSTIQIQKEPNAPVASLVLPRVRGTLKSPARVWIRAKLNLETRSPVHGEVVCGDVVNDLGDSRNGRELLKKAERSKGSVESRVLEIGKLVKTHIAWSTDRLSESLAETVESGAGVCRHCASLFYVLAHQAGVEAQVVRIEPGMRNVFRKDVPGLHSLFSFFQEGAGHAANVVIADGKAVPVDSGVSPTLTGFTDKGRQVFQEAHYMPWFGFSKLQASPEVGFVRLAKERDFGGEVSVFAQIHKLGESLGRDFGVAYQYKPLEGEDVRLFLKAECPENNTVSPSIKWISATLENGA